MLDKAGLKDDLKAAFEAQKAKEEDWESAIDDLCTKISDAIVLYVKSATIQYTSGLIAPQGPVTGTFLGGLI